MRFLEKDAQNISEAQAALTRSVIRAMFRFPQAEYTFVGLRGLLGMNRCFVKNLFLKMNDPEITRFIKENCDTLGLDGLELSKKKKLFAFA